MTTIMVIDARSRSTDVFFAVASKDAVGGIVLRYASSGFIPQQDQGYLILSTQLPDAASISRTREVVQAAARAARDIDGVKC